MCQENWFFKFQKINIFLKKIGSINHTSLFLKVGYNFGVFLKKIGYCWSEISKHHRHADSTQ